jgi:hypothetical protein
MSGGVITDITICAGNGARLRKQTTLDLKRQRATYVLLAVGAAAESQSCVHAALELLDRQLDNNLQRRKAMRPGQRLTDDPNKKHHIARGVTGNN